MWTLIMKRILIIEVISVLFFAHQAFCSIEVGQFKILELTFKTGISVPNPFDNYLLKIEITSPSKEKIIIDGFYDGTEDKKEGQVVWKARICPSEIGKWFWKTVPGDNGKDVFHASGHFECVRNSDGDLGGLIKDNSFFRFKNGGYIFLQGNFLDFTDNLTSTHVLLSEELASIQRKEIINKQREVHAANKINIYFANLGDYGGRAVTPWKGTKKDNDKSKLDITRWRQYDAYIEEMKKSSMFAEMWFFADDSNFGQLAVNDKKRLVRYAMARTSAYNHTLFVIALEWAEGWAYGDVNTIGEYIQKHNPWKRLVSVHNISPTFRGKYLHIKKKMVWPFDHQKWPGFIASQAGNGATPTEVNKLAIRMRNKYALPHLSEEFGILNNYSDSLIRGNMWANLCGGAAGGGTGSDIKIFMRFLAESQIPFQRMAPANHLVSGGGQKRFCLAEVGHHYLVYSMGGPFSLNIEDGSNLVGKWINPRVADDTSTNTVTIYPGQVRFVPPFDIAKDWVLWVTDKSNLNKGPIYPFRSIGKEFFP